MRRHSSSRLALQTVRCWLILLVGLPYVCSAGTWSVEQIAQMPVHIYVPDTAPKLAHKRALMISIGGCGQQAPDNTEFRDQSNWQVTADDYGMVVAIPNAPDGGVLWVGCWDYYGKAHSLAERHNDNLLALVSELQGRPSLNIDSNQIYLSGLSSGGGLVNVLACLAPHILAGGGNAAGPALGTTAMETTFVATTAAQMFEDCRELAGEHAGALSTQVFSSVWGKKDPLVSPKYAEVVSEAFALIYGAMPDEDDRVISGNLKPGVEKTWSDPQGVRVSQIMVDDLGHAWPSGGGSGESKFMDNSSINYPAELTAFLFENNRRVVRTNN